MALTPPPSIACTLFLLSVLANFGGSTVCLLLGLWFLESRRQFEPLFGHNFYTICVYIFIGCVAGVCLFSLLGAAAVLAAKRWQILLYASVIALCGLAIGGTGITSLFFHDQIRQIINVSLNTSMSKYYGAPGHEAITSSIDVLQDSMPCCGYILYNDWINADLYRNQTQRNGTSAPISCCLPQYRLDINPRCNEGFPFPVSSRKLHQKGCLPMLESWYREHAFIIGTVASAIAAFLLLGFCTAMHHFREVSGRLKLEDALKTYGQQKN